MISGDRDPQPTTTNVLANRVELRATADWRVAAAGGTSGECRQTTLPCAEPAFVTNGSRPTSDDSNPIWP